MSAPDPLSAVRRATARRSRAMTDWRAAIIGAHARGFSLREIAKAAGVSHIQVRRVVRGE